MKLFEPGIIGKMRLKNRIIMAAMGSRGLSELDGRFSERAIDYYEERAKGGVGLITTGALPFHVVESHLADGLWSFRPRADNVVYIARLNELANAVHQYGAKICAQLTAGFGRVAHLTVSKKLVAPSSVSCFWDKDQKTRPLTTREIHLLIKQFGIAAKILKMSEFDAIELHAHEGYLFDQFMTRLWNKRKDRYGGDLDGRLRFPLEVIQEIRNIVGAELAIIFRYGAKHFIEGGRDIEESQEIAVKLESAGVDALHVDAGCYESWYWAHPPIYHQDGCMVDLAAKIKKTVNIPIIAVGKLGKPEVAERTLADSKADFIALARPLLCDPEWPRKVLNHAFDDIRPCIGDHDGCHHRIVNHAKTLSCTVNPQVGMEKRYSLKKSDNRRKILIIGGGPAGMEVARVAALRGHVVTIWEKDDRLGGKLVASSVPDFKKDLRILLRYYEIQLMKHNVSIKLKCEATVESIKDNNPDVVIIATGANPKTPNIPIEYGSNVASAIDVLMGKAKVDKHVIVAGGGVTGCEVALYLSQLGKKITVVERELELMPEDVNLSNKQMLFEMMKGKPIEFHTKSEIIEIHKEGVIVNFMNNVQNISGDTVVLALGLKSESQLYRDLLRSNIDIDCHAIGDSVKPRKILNAIWDGFHAARML